MVSFSHVIEIDAKKRELTIYRLEQDGTRVLYTVAPLPEITVSEGIEEFQRFAQQLGENILLDSPAIRKIYNL